MIKFQPSPREPFRLDLVPMVNIVFLLLIFFMLASTTTKRNHEVDLPEAKTAELNTNSNLVILITPKGQIEYEGTVVSLDALLPALEIKLRDRKEKIVEIQADKNVEFELFGNVINVAKQAGSVGLVLATDSSESSKSST